MRTLHTLVANAFLDKPDWANQVNHKNGNKRKNDASNLEWTDGKGNIRHAYSTGLHDNRAKGEDHGMNKYSSKTIHKVCKKLSSGKYTVTEVSRKTGVPTATIHDIIAGKYWVDISSEYDLSNIKSFRNTELSNMYRDKIKKLAYQGLTSKEIREKLNLDYSVKLYSLISYYVKRYKMGK